MDPGRLKAIENPNEAVPKAVGEVRQLAGILSYCRSRYRPGRANADADALAIMLINIEDHIKRCFEEASQDVLDAVNQHCSNCLVVISHSSAWYVSERVC
ncbi:hypothetical protein ACROYT_G007543 [Oculina patagonica]